MSPVHHKNEIVRRLFINEKDILYQAAIVSCQVVVSLEEVEDEGLLMSWTLSKQPSFTLSASPCKLQRQVRISDSDTTNTICPSHIVSGGLVSQPVYSLQTRLHQFKRLFLNTFNNSGKVRN